MELDVGAVADGIERAIDAGDNELALKMALAAETYFGERDELSELASLASDRLRSENQFINPFKYTVYSEIIGTEERHVENR